MRIIFISLLLIFVSSSLLAGDKGPPLRADYPAKEVAKGVYVIHGPLGLPSPENQGFMNNPVFIVTGQGVVVVDPGSSVQAGEMVLAQVRKVTDSPVVAVFNSHDHGDHWLGNQAIVTAYPDIPIYGHPNLLKSMERGTGEQWVDIMLQLTEGATLGTEVVPANHPVDHGAVLNFGETRIEVMHFGQAHTDNDILLYLPEQKVMLLGDVACYGRIPRMIDGSFTGSVATLNKVLAAGATIFVPNHGPTAGPEAATDYRDYLDLVYSEAKKGYEQDLSDFEIKPKLLPLMNRWKDWVDFDIEFGKHISHAYLEVEAADF